MAAGCKSGKTLPLVYRPGAPFRRRASTPALGKGQIMAVGIAIAMFIALFGWGSNFFGWSDPEGKVQLALVTSFILGIIGGYRAKN